MYKNYSVNTYNMKSKLQKVASLLREPKPYNNIQYVLGILDSLIEDCEKGEKAWKVTVRGIFKK